MKIGKVTLAAMALAGFAIVGCGNDSGPTGASTAPAPLSAAPSVTNVSAASARSSTAGTSTDLSAERFSCEEVQEVRARFGKPGFAFGPVVGLFLEYEGAPPGDKIVEITWDEKNKPGEVERLNVGEGDAQQDGIKFDLIGLIAWFYDDLEGTEERQIRVNLRIEGRDGECSRVRRVTVEPGPSLGVGPRGGGSRSASGLILDAGTTIQGGGIFNASAVVINKTDEIAEGVRVAFATPPFFHPLKSAPCEGGTGSGSSEGGIIFCNVGPILPGRQTIPAITVQYSAQTIGDGTLVPGAVGLMHGGVLGQVHQYLVPTGKGGPGVTSLRDLAR